MRAGELPGTGAQTVLATFADEMDWSLVTTVNVSGGSSQSAPFRTASTNTGASQTVSVTCTAGTGDLVFDVFAYAFDATHTVGANQTQRSQETYTTANESGGTSTQAGADGGAMTWTTTADAAGWRTVAAALVPGANARISGAILSQ
jgi:hypothetical protein